MGRLIVNILIFVFISSICSATNIEIKVHHWRTNEGLPKSSITSINQDSIGYILFNCKDGVYRFNGQTSILKSIVIESKQQDSIHFDKGKIYFDKLAIDGYFNGLLKTSKNEYWVCSYLGLGKINVKTKNILWVNKPGDLPNSDCYFATESKDGKIWFAMANNELGFFDPILNKFLTLKNVKGYGHYINAYDAFAELVDHHVNHLFFDNYGNLWIATDKNGVYKISFHPQRFQLYRFQYNTKGGLAHKDISFPLATLNEEVWISTWGGGINICPVIDLEASKPDFENVPILLENNKPVVDKRIFPLVEDSRSNIWFGTFNGGLYFLDANKRKAQHYNFKSFTTYNSKMPSNKIGSLCEGLNNDIWCGTYSGLIHIDSCMNIRTAFSELENPKVFSDLNVSMVSITKDKKMWIGTFTESTYLFDMVTNKVTSFSTTEGYKIGDLYNRVEVDGISWFVGGNGVFYYSNRLNKFLPFKNNHLLPSQHVESILVDDNKKIWIGTDEGLVKIDPISAAVTVFDLNSGRMGNSYTQGASRDKNGYLYFGTRYGFYRFHPDNFEFQMPPTPIVVSEISISGNNYSLDSIKHTDKWIHKKRVTPYIELEHNENAISLEYGNLNYDPGQFIIYETMLQGNDLNWEVTNDNRRSWASLEPGSYTFKVREKGKDNLTVISFDILKPWWATIYATVVYGAFILLSICIFYRIISSRSKAKEELLQKEKFDHLRFRFFLNISHEIRTPLTLIKGAIDRLIDNDNQGENKELYRIKKNTNRLIRMVNEVLDLKKIENTQVQVKYSHFNLKDFLESTVDAFRLREDKCKIALKMPDHPVWINSGRELIETILYNLLSNAIKFSKEKSIVDVSLLLDDNNCQIKVRDYGIGMDKTEQELIFDRYYKGEKNINVGTGIGLSLVQEFVNLLKGNISVESEINKGTTISFSIPNKQTDINTGTEHIGHGNDKMTLVIVDDHSDIRSFVKEIFEDDYHCLEADNGKIAFDIIKSSPPDLVISDVMMPEMNGFQLCEKIKGDIEVSHIPVVLLTAKTGFEAEINAAECSAEAYITKPFNEKLLKTKVDKLIEQRKRLWEKYTKQQDVCDDDVLKLSAIDKSFMNLVEVEIEKEIDNTKFNVDHLASNVALSSSGLYRKIKALTGQSPVEYIRSFRLKKAAQLLLETSYSVSEVSDMTGFGTQKYFSRCFKEQFEITPLKYRKEK